MGNDRGQYGQGHGYGTPLIGLNPPKNLTPWIVGGAAVALAALVVIGSQAAAANQGPQLTTHDKEVRAWEAEFPGLPWYEDQVKTSEQLDTWQRARDYWERKHG